MNPSKLCAAACVCAALALVPSAARGDVLGIYTFTGADPGGDLLTPNDTGSAAANLLYTSYARTGLTQVIGNDSFRTGAYTTATSIDLNEFSSFTVTADAGFALELHSITLTSLRTDGGTSTTRGPMNNAIRASFENYAPGSGTGSIWNTTANSPFVAANWDFTDFTSGSGGSATFRFYGWNSDVHANAGLSYDNVTLNGEVVALARMDASVDAPASVIVGASGNVDVSIANSAAGGTVQQGLAYDVTGTGDVSGSGGNASLMPGPADVVTLTVNTSVAGARAGGVSVTSNAYSTNGVVGESDFDQAVTVNVLDHATASLSGDAAVGEITVDFGSVQQGSAASGGFSIHNLEATSGFTAGLDLDEILETDAEGVFSSDLALFQNLLAGGQADFSVQLDTSGLGTFNGSLVLSLSDEDLPGAAGGQGLTINLVASVVAAPEPGGLALACAGGLLMLRRARRSERPAACAG